jgi:hypothetical protein
VRLCYDQQALPGNHHSKQHSPSLRAAVVFVLRLWSITAIDECASTLCVPYMPMQCCIAYMLLVASTKGVDSYTTLQAMHTHHRPPDRPLRLVPRARKDVLAHCMLGCCCPN